MSKLSLEEQNKLVELMNKVEFPLPLEVFYSWCLNLGSSTAELLLMRKIEDKTEIFLEYREDKFFQGWHIPGCVHLPTESIEDTLNRVIEKEIRFKITSPEFLFWFEYEKGEGLGESPRGHVFSFLYKAFVDEVPELSSTRKFFDLNNLPEDVIKQHIPVLNKLRTEFL